jgi:hypothetical protein
VEAEAAKVEAEVAEAEGCIGGSSMHWKSMEADGADGADRVGGEYKVSEAVKTVRTCQNLLGQNGTHLGLLLLLVGPNGDGFGGQACMEHYTSTLATNESIWLCRLLCKIGQDQPNPTVLKTDNQASISLAQNPMFHKATKHIEVRYHHMRHCFKSKIILPTYISTNDQVADILTKALPKDKHKRFSNAMGLTWK